MGGNMDLNDLGEGASLYLPVFQRGAQFFTGDSHHCFKKKTPEFWHEPLLVRSEASAKGLYPCFPAKKTELRGAALTRLKACSTRHCKAFIVCSEIAHPSAEAVMPV